MGRSTAIQERMFDESIDSQLAVAADKYVDLVKEKEKVGKDLQNASGQLIVEMNKSNRLKVRHQGKIFEIVSSDPKQKIKVKDADKKQKPAITVRQQAEAPESQEQQPAEKSKPKKPGKARNSKLKKDGLKLHKK